MEVDIHEEGGGIVRVEGMHLSEGTSVVVRAGPRGEADVRGAELGRGAQLTVLANATVAEADEIVRKAEELMRANEELVERERQEKIARARARATANVEGVKLGEGAKLTVLVNAGPEATAAAIKHARERMRQAYERRMDL